MPYRFSTRGDACGGHLSKERVWAVGRTVGSNTPNPNFVTNEMADSLPPNVSIPHDIQSRPQEERIALAIAAIQASGTKLNGDPVYSVRQAAQQFNIPRTTLGRRLQGMYYFSG